MTQPTILACFTCPALFKWNGRPISTDAGEPSQSGSCDFNRKLKIADNVGLVFLKVHWKYILHAFELATHLDYQHFCVCVCVCQSMPSDQLVKDWRRRNCASLLLSVYHQIT